MTLDALCEIVGTRFEVHPVRFGCGWLVRIHRRGEALRVFAESEDDRGDGRALPDACDKAAAAFADALKVAAREVA